jgi:hypothetical protein
LKIALTKFHALLWFVILEALVLRLSTVSADVNVEMRRALIEKEVLSMPRGMCTSAATLDDIAQYAKQIACPKDGKRTIKPLTDKGTEDNFKLQMEETEGYI